MSEQNQTQQLQNDVLILKARVFDLNEIIQQKEQTLGQHQKLLSQICKLVEIDGSQGVQPEAILGAIEALLPVKGEDKANDEVKPE